jgi:formamidopyrimidine-DNA glycosylase
VPELPEVETTLRGIEPHILNKKISSFLVRQDSLRWVVPTKLIQNKLINKTFSKITRRGKYLLLESSNESLIVHLGMSGSLRISSNDNLKKHDHIDICFADGTILRYCDPRRFGCFLWTNDPETHFLLKDLGPEPLGNHFNGDHLFDLSRKRKTPIKNFIMNSRIVVGVGNIYASEALFASKIRPSSKAGRVPRKKYDLLAQEIVKLLRESIKQGGTTLRDFVGGNNQPGYFKQSLKVYGREGENCYDCSFPIKGQRIGQRASAYCPNCQSNF